jgi:hypothetical protein
MKAQMGTKKCLLMLISVNFMSHLSLVNILMILKATENIFKKEKQGGQFLVIETVLKLIILESIRRSFRSQRRFNEEDLVPILLPYCDKFVFLSLFDILMNRFLLYNNHVMAGDRKSTRLNSSHS